ncbi:GntR family transcriptional regulator [Actinomadura monticuli]|uniref:Winged helix-turn-helix domain-containing protein n=1 Tax=Actinomadura monticuli TaxID=3097367 RepID=A0ABV4QLH1_9ACTN
MGGIDFEGPDPLYVQLANLIRSRIQNGTYPLDRRIPSVAELVQETGLANTTVQQGLRILKDEGILRAVPGRGTFAVKPDDD